MQRNTCQFVVGRLLEICVAGGYKSRADVDEMIDMIGTCARELGPNRKFSIVADWRPVHIMSPETAARAREMLAQANPRVIRSAVLTGPESPTTNLQVVRLVREAENRQRKHFTSTWELQTWLSEGLSKAESARLRVFLGMEDASGPIAVAPFAQAAEALVMPVLRTRTR